MKNIARLLYNITLLHLTSQGLCPLYFRGICQKSIRPNNRFVPYPRKSFARIADCLCYNHFCLTVDCQTTKTGLTPFETFSLMNSDILLHIQDSLSNGIWNHKCYIHFHSKWSKVVAVLTAPSHKVSSPRNCHMRAKNPQCQTKNVAQFLEIVFLGILWLQICSKSCLRTIRVYFTWQ